MTYKYKNSINSINRSINKTMNNTYGPATSSKTNMSYAPTSKQNMSYRYNMSTPNGPTYVSYETTPTTKTTTAVKSTPRTTTTQTNTASNRPLTQAEKQAVYNAGIQGGLSSEQASATSGYTPTSANSSNSNTNSNSNPNSNNNTNTNPNPNPNTSNTTTNRYISPSVPAPKTVEQIQNDMRLAAQSQIDSLNDYYDTLKNESMQLGQSRLDKTDAISALSGSAGSTSAAINSQATEKMNAQDLAKVAAERSAAIGSILNNIRTNAITEARNQRNEARQNWQDKEDYRIKSINEARNNLKLLANSGSGVTLNGLKNTLSQDEYNTLINNAGGEAMAKAIIFQSRPQNDLIGTPTVVGGHMVQYYKAPDGSIKSESVPLPEGVSPDSIIQKSADGGLLVSSDGGNTWKKVYGTKINDTSSTNVSGTSTGDQTTVDSTSRSILAQTGLSYQAFLALTGQLSKLSRDQKTRNAALNEAAQFANANGGTDISTFASQYEAINNNVKFNTMRNNQAKVAENEMLGTLKNIAPLAKTLNLKNLRRLNVAKIWAGKELNSAAAEGFKFHLRQLRSELAMYNAAAGGQLDANGGIKKEDEADMKAIADNIIQNGFATGSIQGFEDAVKNSQNKMKVILGNSISDNKRLVWDLFGLGKNYDQVNNPNSDTSNNDPLGILN